MVSPRGVGRRPLLVAAAGAAGLAPGVLHAQGAAAPRRIGWLSPFPADFGQLLIEAVTPRLAALGHAAGRDIAFEARFANRNMARLPELARELVGLQPALVVSTNNNATQALMEATKTIPIVMAGGLSPVLAGLVASLARPGGNVTGTVNNQPEIAGKMLEVLKAASPRMTRVTTVWNPDIPGMVLYRPPLVRTAERLGVTASYLDVRRAEEFSMEALVRTRPDAVIVTYDQAVAAHADAIVQAARERKWLTLGVLKAFVQSGGLMSLGPDPVENEQNLADIIDRLLRGAKPAELPVREPSRFQLVVSVKNAQAIGLVLPREVLVLAQEVLE